MSNLTKHQAWILSEGICPICRKTIVEQESAWIWRCAAPSCKEKFRLNANTMKETEMETW